MSHPGAPWRRVTVALALALGGCALAGCSGAGGGSSAATTIGPISFEFSGDAAKVNDTTVPASVIADTLAVFAQAPAATQQAFGESTVNQPGSSQPLPTIVADILTTEISVRLIQTEVEARGLTVSDRARTLAETQMKAFFGDTLDGQTAYQQVLIDRYALYVTLDQALNGAGPDDAALRAEYDKDPAAYDQACARHILVETEAEANNLLAQLAAGADFAALAQASSTDPGSGASGGDLGCQARGVFVPEFEKAVWEGPLGVVQGPIKTDFGYHLIEVGTRGARTFEEARDDVANALAPEPFAALQGWLSAQWGTGAITVDERFGTWDAATGKVNPLGFVGEGLRIGSASTTAG